MLNMAKDNETTQAMDVNGVQGTTCEADILKNTFHCKCYSVWLNTSFISFFFFFDYPCLVDVNQCSSPVESATHPTGASKHHSIYCPGSINNATQPLRGETEMGYGCKYERYELHWQGPAKLAPVISRGAGEWNNRQMSFIVGDLQPTCVQTTRRLKSAQMT